MHGFADLQRKQIFPNSQLKIKAGNISIKEEWAKAKIIEEAIKAKPFPQRER